MWSYFLLCLFPGVWIGPLQGQPGEGHERLGIRSVQLTGYVHFQNQSEVQGTEKRETDCNIFNLCCFQKWGEAGLLCSTQVLVAFSYIFIQKAGVAVGLGLINRSGNEVCDICEGSWTHWEWLKKEHESLTACFSEGVGELNFTVPLVGNGVVLFGRGPESERIVLCAVLMQRVIAWKDHCATL